MFAYCMNNPVMGVDSQGKLANWLVGGVVGALVGGVTSAMQGGSFWVGAAQGAVSGAIAGAAVDVSLAILATGGLAAVPIALACGSSFLGGAAGNIAGEQTQSLLTEGKLKSVDGNMLKRSAAAGAVNVAAMGASGLLKYADEGRATFGNGKKFATNLKNSFSNNMSNIDVTSAFITTHLAFDGYAISLFWEN